MDTQKLIEEKVALLQSQGLDTEEIKTYIAKVLELAFLKTIAPKIEELPENMYQKLVESLEEGTTEEVISLLFETEGTEFDEVNEKIFTLQVQDALALA